MYVQHQIRICDKRSRKTFVQVKAAPAQGSARQRATFGKRNHTPVNIINLLGRVYFRLDIRICAKSNPSSIFEIKMMRPLMANHLETSHTSQGLLRR